MLGACAAIVAVTLAVTPRWLAVGQQRITAAWNQRIASSSESDAAELVRSLRQEGTEAIPTLASAMADQRPMVAAAARETVGNLVADLRHLPARDSVPRMTALTSRLADGYDRLPPIQRQFVRQLAQSVLAWPLADADFPADDLVVQCERLLALPAPRSDGLEIESLPATVDAAPPELPPVASSQIATRPRATPLIESNDQEAPAQIVELPSLSPAGPSDTDPPPSVGDSDGPRSEPRPVEPRQFIRPRVPQIPPPEQP